VAGTELEVGLLVKIEVEDGPEAAMQKVRGFDLDVCHISTYEPATYSAEYAERLRTASGEVGVRIAALWAGWPGRRVWDLMEGPETIGLVPYDVRTERAQLVKTGATFAAELGIPTVITHLGFIPEEPKDERYTSLIPVLRDIGVHCARLDQHLCFETGQETPVTLLRVIEDIGLPNIGVNLDPANLLLYGKGNPVDAVVVLGRYIRGVHVKDGEYPTNGRDLGLEKPVGEGSVDFPRLLRKLWASGYRGELCIESEFEGEAQLREISKAKVALGRWLEELDRTQ
jgi:L-ribulose-5-phosphate 3-epimerase